MLGPTGVGALDGRRELLEEMAPVTTGGSMESRSYAPPPLRFEAGNQVVAQAIGMGSAASYLAELGMPAVAKHEATLTRGLLVAVASVPHVARCRESLRCRAVRLGGVRTRHPLLRPAREGAAMTLTTANPSTPPTAADVEEALRDVIDPELGINILDLGLVCGLTHDQNNHAVIDTTLTSAACPLTDVNEDQAAASLDGLVDGFGIDWVWMPPWGPEKITPDGREQTRALGFNI